MIAIKDVEILDILPYTMKTTETQAISRAIKSITTQFYSKMSNVLFWGDIQNSEDFLLDAMAAELDAPFYNSAMPVDKKRAVIQAAYDRNSRIGTTSMVQELLTAAFGGGKVLEWYEYGGKPLYFKTNVNSEYPSAITHEGLELYVNNIGKIKPLRAKLDAGTFSHDVTGTAYIGIGILKIYENICIPALQPEV